VGGVGRREDGNGGFKHVFKSRTISFTP